MNTTNRISCKLFFKRSIDVKEYVPLFHRLIQNDALDDLLIDVHDYTHVHNGPGVLLIANEGFLSIDGDAPGVGLCYGRKRGLEGDMAQRMGVTISGVIAAVLALQKMDADPIDTTRMLVSCDDRLACPNDQHMAQSVAPILKKVANRLWNEDVEISHELGDPRRPLAFTITAKTSLDLTAALGRLRT